MATAPSGRAVPSAAPAAQATVATVVDLAPTPAPTLDSDAGDSVAAGSDSDGPGADPDGSLMGQATGAPATNGASIPADAGGAPASSAAHLAAQMVRQINMRSSRFDLQLDPAGLGQVRVSVEIDARGRLSASLSFDRPESAAALQAQSGVLQAALERAGFDLSSGGLSFATADSGGGSDPGGGQAFAGRRGRAFETAAESAAQTDAAADARLAPTQLGLDIRI